MSIVDSFCQLNDAPAMSAFVMPARSAAAACCMGMWLRTVSTNILKEAAIYKCFLLGFDGFLKRWLHATIAVFLCLLCAVCFVGCAKCCDSPTRAIECRTGSPLSRYTMVGTSRCVFISSFIAKYNILLQQAAQVVAYATDS